MGKYCYEFIDRLCKEAKDFEGLVDLVSKDREALKELRDLRNIDTNDSIRQELENIVNSYEDLREQFQR